MFIYSNDNRYHKMLNYSLRTNKFLQSENNLGDLIAVLGPTNTGKTHYAIERMLKFSSGIELRAKGFMFYGYPAAVTLEHHFPISDNEEKDSKTYIRFLFDFYQDPQGPSK